MAVELNDTQRFPRRDIQDDDQLMVFGGKSGPGAVPASGLGGGSSGVMMFFPGPLTTQVAPAWRAVMPQTLDTLAIWLGSPSSGDCTVTLDVNGEIIDSITLEAGQLVASKSLTTPIDAHIETVIKTGIQIASGQTGRDATVVLTKG